VRALLALREEQLRREGVQVLRPQPCRAAHRHGHWRARAAARRARMLQAQVLWAQEANTWGVGLGVEVVEFGA